MCDYIQTITIKGCYGDGTLGVAMSNTDKIGYIGCHRVCQNVYVRYGIKMLLCDGIYNYCTVLLSLRLVIVHKAV